jgi:catechol 2,3-dioxygenase-like lactoylglutathione lyase family enzyme
MAGHGAATSCAIFIFGPFSRLTVASAMKPLRRLISSEKQEFQRIEVVHHGRETAWLDAAPAFRKRRDIMSQPLPPLGIQRVKVVALAVTDIDRANRFYKEKLGLEPAFEGEDQVGWWLGQVILMLKPDWAAPTEFPNPRVTLATDHAPATQEALQTRGIVIANEVQVYGDFYVGSFLDSEGNKLWFCSPADGK